MRLFVPQSDAYKHVIGNIVKHLFKVILNGVKNLFYVILNEVKNLSFE